MASDLPLPTEALNLTVERRLSAKRDLSGESREQIARADGQRLGQFADVDNRHVAFAAFNAANVVAMQAALETQLLLRKAGLLPEFPQAFTHCRFDFLRGHDLTSHFLVS